MGFPRLGSKFWALVAALASAVRERRTLCGHELPAVARLRKCQLDHPVRPTVTDLARGEDVGEVPARVAACTDDDFANSIRRIRRAVGCHARQPLVHMA